MSATAHSAPCGDGLRYARDDISREDDLPRGADHLGSVPRPMPEPPHSQE